MSTNVSSHPNPATETPAAPVTLSAGEARATIDLARGGRLASLTVGGRELLVPPPEDHDRSIRWGCFLMAPWPGRLAEARLAWDGQHIQLPRDFGRHAIHGLVYREPWRLERATRDRAELACDLPEAWPFGGLVRQRVTLDGLGLELEAEIVAERSMPAALGWHPWFDRRAADPRLRVAADRFLQTRGMIPTGELAAVRDRTDLRTGPLLGDRRLDHAYVDVASPVAIAWPDLELDITFESPVTDVVVHTPRGRFCVEPQTAPPNALGEPPPRPGWTGPGRLEAGESLRARIRLAWREVAPADGGRFA